MSATSSATDSVETVYDLLDGAQSSVWTNADPEVHHMWDVSARGRENNNDPSLYVWSPVEGDLSRFSADGDHLIDNQVVEISVWTLDSINTTEYAEDVIDLLGDYIEDNEDKITFRNIAPTSVNDLRAEHVTRNTDHYIIAIQVDVDGLLDV